MRPVAGTQSVSFAPPVLATTRAPAPPEFDPTYGYSLSELGRVQPPFAPPDFAAFWSPRYARAVAIPPRLSLSPPKRTGDFAVHVAHFDGVGGTRLGGWLALPVSGAARDGVVSVHGYGGREAPTAAELARYAPTTAVLFPCIRGFGLSIDPSIPGDSTKHVVHGIESRETYALGGSVADIWSATGALLAAVPATRQRLILEGASFGGGIGILALAWDKRFAKAYFEVPTFGHQPLRMRLPTFGSANAVQEYIAKSGRPANVYRTLGYFDAGAAARLVTTPTLVAAALSDALVAPPGQFAVYNALAGRKDLFVMSLGHADLPPAEARRLAAKREAWLTRWA
ncbi:MAG: acetylxylan esterase [Myxococcota bacterium]